MHEFEEAIAELLGVRHCIAMCNGTVALEIAIRAAGLTGEVIVPSFTFVATAHALQWQEITRSSATSTRAPTTSTPTRVEELITPRTTGILGVHLWGRPCRSRRSREIADRHGLRLLFDAAHAFGCSSRGPHDRRLRRAEVLSFHATKFVNTFEGGAIVTDDDDLASRSALMRNFGFAGYDKVSYVGTNGKMTEVAAAMGLTSLEWLRRVRRRQPAQLRGVPRRRSPASRACSCSPTTTASAATTSTSCSRSTRPPA